jgi:hypothetical protein
LGLFFNDLLTILSQILHLTVQFIDFSSLTHQFFPQILAFLSRLLQLPLKLPNPQIFRSNDISSSSHLVPHSPYLLRNPIAFSLQLCDLSLIELFENVHVLVVFVVVLVDVKSELCDVCLEVLD